MWVHVATWWKTSRQEAVRARVVSFPAAGDMNVSGRKTCRKRKRREARRQHQDRNSHYDLKLRNGIFHLHLAGCSAKAPTSGAVSRSHRGSRSRGRILSTYTQKIRNDTSGRFARIGVNRCVPFARGTSRHRPQNQRKTSAARASAIPRQHVARETCARGHTTWNELDQSFNCRVCMYA